MNMFNSCSPISKMFQHFQTHNEGELIILERQVARISLNNFSFSFSLSKCFSTSIMIKFNSDITARFYRKLLGKHTRTCANFKHLLSGRQPGEHKIIPGTMQDDLQAVFRMVNIQTFQYHMNLEFCFHISMM